MVSETKESEGLILGFKKRIRRHEKR